MQRVIKILFYAVFIIIAYFVVSMIFKSCKQKSATMLEESGEIVDEATDIFDDTTDEIVEVFGEDTETTESLFDDDSSELAEELFDTDETVDEPIASAPVSKPKKKTAPVANNKTYNSGDRYMVVSGNFLVKDNAISMVKRLKQMGYRDAEHVVFDASNYYTVVAAKSDSRSKAQGASNELKNRGIDCYVHTKQ